MMETFADYVVRHCRKHKYSATFTEFWRSHARCEVHGCGLWSAAPHHIRSRGAGGDDNPRNLLALCTRHHFEAEQYGDKRFAKMYPEVAEKVRSALERPKVTTDEPV